MVPPSARLIETFTRHGLLTACENSVTSSGHLPCIMPARHSASHTSVLESISGPPTTAQQTNRILFFRTGCSDLGVKAKKMSHHAADPASQPILRCTQRQLPQTAGPSTSTTRFKTNEGILTDVFDYHPLKSSSCKLGRSAEPINAFTRHGLSTALEVKSSSSRPLPSKTPT